MAGSAGAVRELYVESEGWLSSLPCGQFRARAAHAVVVAEDPEDSVTGEAVEVHAAVLGVVGLVGEDLEADVGVGEVGVEGREIHPCLYCKYITLNYGLKFLTSFVTDFNLSVRSVWTGID